MGRGIDAQAALDYRTPMQVQKLIRYRYGGTFPICPRCSSPIEREYQSFCDRCGQRLGWKGYRRALVVTRY